MIVVYSSPGCASCRKVKQWLKTREIKFYEKNLFSVMLNEKEIKYLLSRSENGTEDLISTRSKIFREMNIDIEDMGTNDLVRFIQANPSVLKRPIILNERNMVVGYDDEEIEVFLPQIRKLSEDSCNEDCPNYCICGKLRKGE